MPDTILPTVAKLRILVTGANGQVGRELRELADMHPDAIFYFQGREDLPLTNFEMIRTVFHTLQPDVLINSAAYTAVDKAEQERELAFQVNAEAVGVMAALCREHGCRFIHISTDYVFPGDANKPYIETDATSPLNVYGASKLAGEEQAFALNPETIVVRTSWVYASHGKNFVRTMLKLMAAKKEINVVNDQWGKPTYAKDLAEVLMTLATMKEIAGGIYHFANAGATTWFQFAATIAHKIENSCAVLPVPSSEFPTPAKRPAYGVLDTAKIEAVAGIRPRSWEEALGECLNKIHQ
jgi:dTDP-4-dehydrorhamnose reductase